MGVCNSRAKPAQPEAGQNRPTEQPPASQVIAKAAPIKEESRPIIRSEVRSGPISHAQFILDNTGKIQDFYNVEAARLGEGSYGYVCKAVCKSTSSVRAVKTIAKARMKSIDSFKKEIGILKRMDHPNIIKMYESFEDHKNVYVVMELCSGGELFDKIIQMQHFSETQAATLMQQLVRAVYYMHENGICHRDLKPENFLFVSKEPVEKNLLKVVDFGLSCRLSPETLPLKTKAGTPYYIAPEVLAGRGYDQLCDLWSCGVIMYVMLCGYPPFYGDTDNQILGKVRRGIYSFNGSDWRNVSTDAKNLIRALLKLNVAERYTAGQTLSHRWIANVAPRASETMLQGGLVERLRNFQSTNKLKKAALHIIAGRLDEGKIKALRETFTALDDNGDGLLTAAELREGICKAGLSELPVDFEEILEHVDSDGSGIIDYTEFLAATLDQRLYLEEDICWAAFRVFDRNGNGQISPDELREVLMQGEVQGMCSTKVDTVAKIMREVDTSGDGLIDFDEFMCMMRGKK